MISERIILKNKTIIGFLQKGIILIACIVESVLLSALNKSDGYRFLFLLPLSYAASYLLFSLLNQNRCNYKRGFPYLVAQAVIAYRYLLVPASCVFTDYVGGWTITGANGFGVEPSSSAMRVATLWMCTEVFFAELALYIGTCYVSKKQKQRVNLRTDCMEVSQRISFLQSKQVMIIFSIVAFTLLLVFQRQVFSQFLVLDTNYALGDNAAGGSFFKLIFFAFKLSLLTFGYAYCARKYVKSKKKVWIWLAMLFLVIYIGYSIGASRWNLILPVIASIEIFQESFKPFPKSLLIAVIAVATIGVLSVSFFKFGYLIENSQNPITSMATLIFQQSNEYVSGPRSIAQGLQTLDTYGDRISVSTFFNSMFSGFAGLSSLTNETDKLGSLFNYFCTGKLQDKPLICPILIEGMAFCPIFPWIFIMIFHICVCIMDYKSRTSNKYEMRFLACYMGLWFALCFALNTKIEISQISQMLAIWLLFKINSKVRIRVK